MLPQLHFPQAKCANLIPRRIKGVLERVADYEALMRQEVCLYVTKNCRCAGIDRSRVQPTNSRKDGHSLAAIHGDGRLLCFALLRELSPRDLGSKQATFRPDSANLARQGHLNHQELWSGRWESNPHPKFGNLLNSLLVGRLRSCSQDVGEGVAKRHGQDGTFGALQPPATNFGLETAWRMLPLSRCFLRQRFEVHKDVLVSGKGVGGRDASNLLSILKVFTVKNSTLTLDC